MLEKFRDILEECTECNLCFEECPISAVIKDETLGPLGKISAARTLLRGGELSDDEYKSVYLCTRCRKCEVVCPLNLPVPDLVQAIRYELAKVNREPEKHRAIAKRIVEYGNPMGQPAEARDRLVPEGMHATKGIDTVYLTGCWSGYELLDVAEATIEVMTRSGFEFSMLGSKEKCCGLFLIDNGYLDAASKRAEENVKLLEELGASTVVVSCAACYDVYNEMYPKLYREPKFKVKHMVQILKELVDSGKIKFRNENSESVVAYMDPCHLGRCGGIYGAPRTILKSIQGLELRELYNNRELASCCGSPAGVKPFAPEISNNVGLNLLKSAQDVGADALVVSCPFCLYHLQDVKNKSGVKIEIKEITQFVLEHMR
ncbi:MAG: (Fe-S)-binding protein [archaeon]|nr:(Fe-S)-binding protein [archaeon]MCP8306792.1 (Fe-S)-binding protein [archaeon]